MARSRRHSSTTEEILHRMIARNPDYSVAQLAEELGKREYVLYEWGNPNQDRQFPLAMLLPLTRVTGDISLIEHLAASVGLVVSRVRKRGKGRLEQIEDLQECLERFAELLKTLALVFRDQEKVDKRAVLAEIDRFMSTLAGIRQDVDNLSDQLDLGLEE